VGFILAALMLVLIGYGGSKVSPRVNRSDINLVIEQTSQNVGLSADYIRAIIDIESSWNEQAQNPSDPSYGLMQVTPPIAKEYGWLGTDPAELYDPQLNIQCGAGFLAYLFHAYSAKYPGEWVQMYNEGETHFRKGARVPEYQARFEAALLSYQG
jgi:hypothetical protein